jgi:hypothetical protein
VQLRGLWRRDYPRVPVFLTFIAHFGAILVHTLIVRDGILKRMAPWNIVTPGDEHVSTRTL